MAINQFLKKNIDIDRFLAEKICKDIISWKTIDDLKHSYFNKISFIDNNTIKDKLKETLTEEAKEKLFTYILFSRESKEILQVSSNSISILNAADFSFTGKDLSNISIPTANLSWNNWIRVNFTSSDLSRVNFSGSNLNCCKFQNCIMTDVKFGILYPNNPHSKPISIFAFSHDKNIIASWSLDKTIKIWNFKSHEVLHELKEIEKVTCFQFSPCGKILAFGGDENIAYLWYIEENCVEHYDFNQKYIAQILFSKCSKHIIFFSAPKDPEYIQISAYPEQNECRIVIIWDIKEKKELSRTTAYIECLSISNCGKLLICGGNKEILLFDISLNLLAKYKFEFLVKYIAFVPNSNKFIVYGGSKVYLWNLNDSKVVKQIQLIGNDIKSFTASNDGLRFAYDTRSENTLSIFQVEKQNITYRSASHLYIIDKPIFANVSNHIGGFFRNGGIKIWKLNHQNPNNYFDRSRITQISVSPCGKYFASASMDGKIKLWGSNNFKLIKTLVGHKDIVNSIVFSPNKDVLVSASKDRTVKAWSMNDFREIRTFITELNVNSLDFSLSGIYLAGIGGYGGWSANSSISVYTYIWNFEEGTRDKWYRTHENKSRESTKIYFLLNEDYVVINDNSGCWIIDWHSNIEKYKICGKWETIAISMCRRYLALGNEFGKLELWDLYQNEVFLDPSEPYWLASVNGHKRSISVLCFSPSGEYLISGARDGIIKIWKINLDSKEMSQAKEIVFGKHEVSSLAFSMCKRFIISGYENGLIRVWEFQEN